MQNDPLNAGEAKMIRFIVEERYRPLRHAILLLTVFLVLAGSHELLDYSGRYKYYRLVFVFTILIGMSYCNIYYLVPRFFFKGKYIHYAILFILLALVGMVLMSGVLSKFLVKEKWPYPPEVDDGRGFYEGTVILTSVVLITTMIKLFQRWIRDRESIAELRNITLTMELNELRNQINPHFLFNMLNGIKALIRTNPEKATAVIMKLSDFLRYQLYENNEQKTSLTSELHFLSNFLELEKTRRDNFTVHIGIAMEPSERNSTILPSNLFTTFVENAVKHSADISGKGSFIKLSIEIKEHKLYFTCINSKDPYFKHPHPDSSGLGLANIKRRLELLYESNYLLDINESQTEYTISLIIPL